jgi:ribosomal protein S27AE
MSRYKTRDPKPQTRDPIREPSAPPPLNHALTIEVQSIKCSRCGGGAFNNCNATRPNKTADKMTRKKQCMRCGQWYVFQSQPTIQERAKYWQ